MFHTYSSPDLLKLIRLTQLYLIRELPKEVPLSVDPSLFAEISKTYPGKTKKEQRIAPRDTAPLEQAVEPTPPQAKLKEIPKVEIAVPSPAPLPVPERATPAISTRLPNQETNRPFFALEKNAPPPQQSTEALKKSIAALFPDWQLVESPLNDSSAKRDKTKWQRKEAAHLVLILSFEQQAAHCELLENIAKAITSRFTPAKVISAAEVNKEGWEKILGAADLRLILVSERELYSNEVLKKDFSVSADQKAHFLRGTPLLLLSDLFLYLKEPERKATLWRSICQQLTHTKRVAQYQGR